MPEPTTSDTPSRTPPGPRGLGLRNFVARLRDPLGFYDGLRREYGEVVRFRTLNLEEWLVNDPEMIHEILIRQAAAFQKGPVLRRAKVVFGNSVLTTAGEEHARQRRLVAPAFSHQHIARHADLITAEARAAQDDWRDGATVAVQEAMHHLTLRIITGTLFGSKVDEGAQRIAEAIDLLITNFHYFYIPGLRSILNLPLPKPTAMRKALRDLDTNIYAMIAERRANPVDRGDLLSLLLTAQDEEAHDAPLSDREVRDQAMTLFLAGQGTTASALIWCWYLLARNPEAEAKLDEELRRELGGRPPAFEDVPKLKYARAVLAEAMRIYPPAWAHARQALTDVEIGGYRIPRNAVMILLQWGVHRDARWWPEPLAFRPERWLGEEAAQAKQERPKFAYFPFSGGPYACIGEGLVWMEGVLILATIAQRWRLHLPADYPDPPPCSAKITLRPTLGLPMRVERRE